MMTVKELLEKLKLEPLLGQEELEKEVRASPESSLMILKASKERLSVCFKNTSARI